VPPRPLTRHDRGPRAHRPKHRPENRHRKDVHETGSCMAEAGILLVVFFVSPRLLVCLVEAAGGAALVSLQTCLGVRGSSDAHFETPTCLERGVQALGSRMITTSGGPPELFLFLVPTPRGPLRSPGPAPQLKWHKKESAPQTTSKAASGRRASPARLRSGTLGNSRVDQLLVRPLGGPLRRGSFAPASPVGPNFALAGPVTCKVPPTEAAKAKFRACWGKRPLTNDPPGSLTRDGPELTRASLPPVPKNRDLNTVTTKT